MAATMDRRTTRSARLPVSRAWYEAGFDRAAAEAWRQAGWSDARVAAEWHSASPHDEPRHLRSLSEAGYIPAQLQRVGQAARRHVAAWAAATVAPAAGGTPVGTGRPVGAHRAVDWLAADIPGDDLVIDLRDRATSAA